MQRTDKSGFLRRSCCFVLFGGADAGTPGCSMVGGGIVCLPGAPGAQRVRQGSLTLRPLGKAWDMLRSHPTTAVGRGMAEAQCSAGWDPRPLIASRQRWCCRLAGPSRSRRSLVAVSSPPVQPGSPRPLCRGGREARAVGQGGQGEAVPQRDPTAKKKSVQGALSPAPFQSARVRTDW